MNHVGLIISKSIKESKWLSIEYHNKENENSRFWCSVLDIEINTKLLKVNIFNLYKGKEVLKDVSISFEQIQNVQILEGTFYLVPESLIQKIENNLDQLLWLDYDGFDNNILNYYKECYKYDNDPFQSNYNLIEGIDLDTLTETQKYKLNDVQLAKMANLIFDINIKDFNKNKYQHLVINIISIDIRSKLFVVAYQNVLLNISEQSLVLEDDIKTNNSFLIEGRNYSLSYYLDMDPNEFSEGLNTNYRYYRDLLNENISGRELIDERPYLMLLSREFQLNLEPTYNAIEKMKKERKLTTPLKAFFGNMNIRDLSKKAKRIFLRDKYFNIDQLRVVHSAMKNKITYVQGPPGTGKTSTIINTILSAFMNNERVLITSNNNKPINDIFKKINFKHKDKDVPFPMVRIGNMDENLKSLKRIKLLYGNSKEIKVGKNNLSLVRTLSDKGFNELNDKINNYEKKLSLFERIEILSKVLEVVKGNKAILLKQELEICNKEYDAIPNDLEEIIQNLEVVAGEKYHYTQYLYYNSFNYIKKLDDDKFNDLKNIINLPENNEEEKQEKNKCFNKYLSDDDNLKNLLEVFPFVLTTNLSANKLGKPSQFFDLLIIDEAGQCNISTSLIPIVRANRLLLVGDQNQLQPVIVLEDAINKRLRATYKIKDNYDYCNNSILGLMTKVDKVSPSILLRYHYRCAKNIIQFSNSRYYDNKLSIETHDTPDSLEYVNVKSGKNQELRNSSYQEAVTIVDIIKKNNYHDVGIITPFRNQADTIKKVLEKNNIKDIDVGTIHTFQGDEKKVIVVSSCITRATSEKTYDWVKNNSNMINVAVTRPKDKIIIVGDYEEIENKSKKKDDDYYNLTKYVKENGNYKVVPSVNTETLGLKTYNTQFEDEFFETLKHITTTKSNIVVHIKMKISSVCSSDVIPKDLLNYFHRGEFDFVIYSDKVPIIVIESDGSEHITNTKTCNNDRKKEMICRLNHIKLYRVPNSYSKRYQVIKELLVNYL